MGELLDEVAAETHAAADNITARVAELENARKHWHEVSGRVASLIRDVPGLGRLPSLDGPDAAIRQLRRDLGKVPPALPVMAAAAMVVPEDDPDPETRGRARAAKLDPAIDRGA